MRRTLTILVACLLTASCKSPLQKSPDRDPQKSPGQAMEAAPIPPGQEPKLPSPNPKGSPIKAAASPGGSGGESRVFQLISSTTDAKGDSSGSPRFADLTSLTIEDDGQFARVAVGVDGAIPEKLAEGEVVGVGIDFFRGATQESDYQLFADGGEEGWFGYFHTPQGIVEFPGTFQRGGTHLVFVVPWSSLGDLRRAEYSAFYDWSKSGTLPLSRSSNDLSPDSGKASFER